MHGSLCPWAGWVENRGEGKVHTDARLTRSDFDPSQGMYLRNNLSSAKHGKESSLDSAARLIIRCVHVMVCSETMLCLAL